MLGIGDAAEQNGVSFSLPETHCLSQSVQAALTKHHKLGERGVINNRFLFLAVLGAGKSESQVWQVVSGEGLPGS